MKISLSSKNQRRMIWMALLGMIATSSTVKAQVYPDFFQPPSEQTAVTLDQGASAAQVPNGLYTSPLMAVYSSGTILGYSVLADGVNVTYNDRLPGTVPSVNCNASTPSTCSAAIAFFNNVIYVAYSDSSTHGLDVVTATVIPGNVGYSFSLVHQDNTIAMTTSPAMAVLGNKLVIVYGGTSSPTNGYYEVSLSGTSWAPASEAQLGSAGVASGSQAGLAVLNNQLWMCIQQNNSNHQMFVYSSSDGTTWNFIKNVSNLALGSGASMVNYNGSLVLATQQNNSNHQLFIFSSADGVNWGDQQYSSTALGATPGLSLFNGDVSLVFKQNNSQNFLFTTQATH